MADKQSTKPPAGTRDFLPDDVRRREYVIGIVKDVYERYGFEPIETPAFENIETLLGKYGEEGNQLIFKILKRGEHAASGEADLALRYDLTVPLARVIAEHQSKLPTFFKRYQIQPVWRADRPARGRFREFFQCDIDTVGSKSPVVEAEQISAVSEILKALGFSDFRILLNHRRLLAGLLMAAGVLPSQHTTALVALDKLDKIGESGVVEEFASRQIDPQAATRLMSMLRNIFTGPPEVSELAGVLTSRARLQAVRDCLASTEHVDAVEQLADIVRLTSGMPVANHVYVDPRLARGLSYYTGAIMEIAVAGIGSLGGGGRYDNLIGMFLGRDMPACGFSLGLERMIVVMTERGMFPSTVTEGAIHVVVTFMDDESRADAMRLATELRAALLRVDVFPEASRKIEKALKYASARGARSLAIFGENERARGEVSIRDLQTRQQQAIARSEAAAYIARTANAEPWNLRTLEP